MNKTLKLALGAVLTSGMIVSAYAQDNFPDVPDNHWAYEALARLKKDGLLVGYPDGLFRGNRPASRYELAVAIHATYVHLKSITDGLQAEIDQIKQGMNGDQLQSLKDAIAQLQDEVNGMKGWGADIDNLKKLADQFQKELASLGVDVEGLKRDLADLSKRVGVLEAHRLPFDIHGDASFYLIGGAASGHEFGFGVDGRPIGVRTWSGGGISTLKPVGLDQDSTIYHELTLKLTSNNDTGPKWHGTVVVGDMLGDSSGSFGGGAPAGSTLANPRSGMPFPSQSRTGSGPFATATESIYIQDLAVDFDTSIVGQGLAAELGRTGYEIDPYIYRRPDPLPYFNNDRWGDGKWYFDGGILGFHWGGVKLDVFGGKQNQETTSNGTNYQTMTVGQVGGPFGLRQPAPGTKLNLAGANLGAIQGLTGENPFGIPVDESLGLNLGVPIGQNGGLDLAFVWFESNAGVDWTGAPAGTATGTGLSDANRADTYGASLWYNFPGGFKFRGGYSASDLYEGNHNYTGRDNFAWHASLGYDAARWGAEIGYRQIMPQFGAPGDWGRIGTWWNPTDIQGPWADLHIKLTDQLHLKLSGEWDEGTGVSFNLPLQFGGTAANPVVGVGLPTGLQIQDYKGELGYKFNDSWDFTLGLEYAYLNGQGLNQPYESWYNLGIGYNLSDQARLKFLAEYNADDAKIKGVQKNSGTLIATQLTVKF